MDFSPSSGLEGQKCPLFDWSWILFWKESFGFMDGLMEMREHWSMKLSSSTARRIWDAARYPVIKGLNGAGNDRTDNLCFSEEIRIASS